MNQLVLAPTVFFNDAIILSFFFNQLNSCLFNNSKCGIFIVLANNSIKIVLNPTVSWSFIREIFIAMVMLGVTKNNTFWYSILRNNLRPNSATELSALIQELKTFLCKITVPFYILLTNIRRSVTEFAIGEMKHKMTSC